MAILFGHCRESTFLLQILSTFFQTDIKIKSIFEAAGDSFKCNYEMTVCGRFSKAQETNSLRLGQWHGGSFLYHTKGASYNELCIFKIAYMNFTHTYMYILYADYAFWDKTGSTRYPC